MTHHCKVTFPFLIAPSTTIKYLPLYRRIIRFYEELITLHFCRTIILERWFSEMERTGFQSFTSTSSQSSISLRRRQLQHPTFLITEEYSKMHHERAHLLHTRHDDVIAVLPDQSSIDSCGEVLELVVQDLANAYKNVVIEGDNVRNTLTGEMFKWRGLTGEKALEVAASLAMEDLNVLMPLNSSEHRLVASVTFFPAGWVLRERLGWPVSKLHEKVPQWQMKLSKSVERISTNEVPTANFDAEFERYAYFMQILPPGYHSLGEALFVQKGSDFFPGSLHFPLEAEAQDLTKDYNSKVAPNFIIRKERQVFRKLNYSRAVLFVVHTHVIPIGELPDDELISLLDEVNSWPDDIATYREKNAWAGWLDQEAKCRVLIRPLVQ